jgi:hypothetical protein
VKKIGEVSPHFELRAWTALIDEDSGYCSAQRRLLTSGCHGYIITNTNDKGQAALSRVEYGKSQLNCMFIKLLYTGGHP